MSLCRGRLDEMYGHARDAAEHEPVHPHTGDGWGTLFLAECHLGHGQAAIQLLNDREADLPRSGEFNGTGAWDALFMTVEGLVVIGERQLAAELYPLTLEAIATGALVTYLVSHLLETVAAIAAAAGRQWAAAETHYQTALRQADEIPFVSEQAEARYWYARMLVDRDSPGDRVRAGELLNSAIKVYKKIGMPWHVERAERLVAEASS